MITTTDLVHACRSLRGQFNLHIAASDRPNKLPALDQVFRDMFTDEVQVDTNDLAQIVSDAIENKVHGAEIRDAESGDIISEINTIR